jgi:hypothetical protein
MNRALPAVPPPKLPILLQCAFPTWLCLYVAPLPLLSFVTSHGRHAGGPVARWIALVSDALDDWGRHRQRSRQPALDFLGDSQALPEKMSATHCPLGASICTIRRYMSTLRVGVPNALGRSRPQEPVSNPQHTYLPLRCPWIVIESRWMIMRCGTAVMGCCTSHTTTPNRIS